MFHFGISEISLKGRSFAADSVSPPLAAVRAASAQRADPPLGFEAYLMTRGAFRPRGSMSLAAAPTPL